MTKKRRRAETETAPSPKGGRPAWTYLAVILAAHIVLGLTYWYYTPYGASPDEGAHGRYVQMLAESRELPVLRASDRDAYEYHQPPLYYLLGVPFYLVGRAVGIDQPSEMVRLLSLILGALSVVIIYRAVLAAFPPRKDLAFTSAGFAALLPTHVMLGSSVSNDPLMELVFGLALLAMARVVVIGPSRSGTRLLGLILGIALLTKTTCVILYPVAIVAYLLAKRRWKLSWVSVAGHATAAVGVSLVVGGWWLVRNQHLYGDPFALSQFQAVFSDTSKPEFFLDRGMGWGGYFAFVGLWTFESFWGVFGHMNVFMPSWIYVAAGVASVGVAVALRLAVRKLRAESEPAGDMLVLHGLVLLLTLAAFVQFNLSFFQAQGRYLYPALIPISVFWALGVKSMLPAGYRQHAPILALAVPALAQIVALSACIPRMPFYPNM